MAGRIWSKEELIVAFNLYLKLPFGRMHQRTPEIIHLAKLIGRTPSAVAMRLSNFASIDPYHQARGVLGLPGGSAQCQPIWDEFADNREELMFESERILAQLEEQTLEQKYAHTLRDLSHLKGEEKVREVKTRVNQQVFRQVVLAAYDGKCAISGVDIPELLVASHIIPWAQNEQERLNPSNGVCLSALYDACFDKGLLGFSHEHKVLLSHELSAHLGKPYYEHYFAQLHNKTVNFPERFRPQPDFLEYHLKEVFRG